MSIQRVFDILEHQVQFQKEFCLLEKINKKWMGLSLQTLQTLSEQLATGLLQAGIVKGDRIAIISENRTEWNILDFAIQMLGAVSVPIYPTITLQEYNFIFKDSGSKLVFVSDKTLYDKVIKSLEGTAVEAVFCFTETPQTKYWKELLLPADFTTLASYKAAVFPSDLISIIYTSGTTGFPKGVMLSHQNITSNIEGAIQAVDINHTHSVLSFLPLCHIFERTILYTYMYAGATIYYAEGFHAIADNLKEVKPHYFTTVPRLLEKIYEKIIQKGSSLNGISKKIFFWAVSLGLEFEPHTAKSLWYNTQLKLANKIIFSKWREALGGNIKAIISGSAALQPRLARVFWAAGIPILEGYGLTETSPVMSVNRLNPADHRIGTVGIALHNVEIKIAADGEIITKGENIMQGYYNRPDLTAECIDAEGWLHTGDIGEWVDGRFLKITDRKKEMFKTSGGKYIAPQLLENKLKESIFIEQAMIVGDGKDFPAALIVASAENIANWAKKQGIEIAPEAHLTHPSVEKLIHQEISICNKSLATHEKIKKFKLLPALFSIEKEELTPTLKLKRKNILKNYAKEIEELYA